MKYMRILLIVTITMIYCILTSAQTQTVGLFNYEPETSEGYVYFSAGKTTFLIDNCGRLVHSWVSNFSPALSEYLLPDGQLLRTCSTNNTTFNAAGKGGRVEMLDWDGNVNWYYQYQSAGFCQHHDVEYLPNGNVLLLAWEMKSEAEAIQAGRNPDLLSDGELWPDHIVEVEPVGASGGIIVWEWHLWDHLVQDFDNSKDNFGAISDNPQLLNVNFVSTGIGGSGADWIHGNAIDYNPQLDQVVMSSRTLSEFYVIDHSTTTAEAASHTGGNSGKGGDILFRWGNPQAYGRGTESDRILEGQHNVQWIEPGLPGEGNFLIFNNGEVRSYSSIDEIVPPVDGFGNYSISNGEAFGPLSLYWTYQTTNPTDFFGSHISGCQRLENGNTLICNGLWGEFFEINAAGQIVWKYINPVLRTGTILDQGTSIPINVPPNSTQNNVFRCTRLMPYFSGFNGHVLDAGDPIEGNPTALPDICTENGVDKTIAGIRVQNEITVFPNPASESFSVYCNNQISAIRIFDTFGRCVLGKENVNENENRVDCSFLKPGIYFLEVQDQVALNRRRIVLSE